MPLVVKAMQQTTPCLSDGVLGNRFAHRPKIEAFS